MPINSIIRLKLVSSSPVNEAQHGSKKRKDSKALVLYAIRWQIVHSTSGLNPRRNKRWDFGLGGPNAREGVKIVTRYHLLIASHRPKNAGVNLLS